MPAFAKTGGSQLIVILGALVAMYIVLGVLYESLAHPLTIISTLPSAGLGALLALQVTNTPLTIVAFVGIILLIGIVKKNGIMIVDFALEAERNSGLSSAEAIFEACKARFRPDPDDDDGGLVRRNPAGDRNRTGHRAAPPARHHHHRRAVRVTDPDAVHDAGDLPADRPVAPSADTGSRPGAGGIAWSHTFSLGEAGCGAYRRPMSAPSETTNLAAEAIPDCPRCLKPVPLCVCDGVTPIESRISLLILQHPQEQDRALGTARLTALHFKTAVVKIGLSWPSLAKALGRPVADPSRWAVLYLGSANGGRARHVKRDHRPDRKGEIAEHQRAILGDIEGVVLLDGTWSQAKALWWRNAWMLKCQRVILNPAHPSRYGKLRREPRRDGLSTIEAAAMLIAGLEKRPDIAASLHASFERMLARYREVETSMPELTPRPNRGRKRIGGGGNRPDRDRATRPQAWRAGL